MLIKTVLLRTLVRQNRFAKFVPLAVTNENYEKYNNGNESRRKYGKAVGVAALSSLIVGSAVSDQIDSKLKQQKDSKVAENVSFEAGEKKPNLPTYRAEEISKHDNKKSFWVTYKHGVYDVTSFLSSHPGGEQILNAGGLSVEPFWNVYGMHKTPEVYKILESYRIGNLHDDDVVDHSDEEMWAKEPRRDSRLLVRVARPFNAEIPPQHQIDHFDTPNELFYVRQHMPVPELDGSHRLHVAVLAGGPLSEKHFSLEDLKTFPRAEVRAALMCAGNRRSEMDKVKPVKGIGWTGGAISCALWSGVYLRDVLLHCGVDETEMAGKHVIFQGADVDATGEKFSTSIPLAQAMSVEARVVLATDMNGAPLPADHGRPLRAVVPGAPAVRSCKWLESITVSTEESPSHWHQKDYRSFNASTTWETADFALAPPLYSLPVTSAICAPSEGDTVTLRGGCIDVRGYAYSGGGAAVVRVDVSADGGRSWVEAERTHVDAAPPREHYAWTLWRATLPLRARRGEVELWVKATDSNFNTQPEKFDDIWNIRGILSNAYHKITVKVQQ